MGYLKNKAAVLQYQNISEDKTNFLDTWIYYKCFEEQLDYLSKKNIPIIPLDDVVAYLSGDLDLKKQSFSLTFDSGYIELYTLCYPLIKRYGFPATFFIRPDTIGKAVKLNGKDVQYMNWGHIQELSKNGMTIGLFGCRGDAFTEKIEGEIKKFKQKFEYELGRKMVYYCVSDGVTTNSMLNLLKREGF